MWLIDTIRVSPKAFWDIGHKLFRTDPETFPVPFIQGNIFDAAHIDPTEPHYSPPASPRPSLSSLKSLNALRGHVSAIHLSLFFHLFGREQQIAAARALAALLSPEPGSMIFGAHHSSSISGKRINTLRGTEIYDFNPEDWTSLWDGEIFKRGTVQVEVGLRDWENRSEEELGYPPNQLVWCIKRK